MRERESILLSTYRDIFVIANRALGIASVNVVVFLMLFQLLRQAGITIKLSEGF